MPRPNSTPEAAARTAEEAAAAKAARRNKKNKARRARRKRKHAAMNNKTGLGGYHGGDPVSLSDYIAWTSAPKPPAAAPSTEPALGRSPRPVTPLLPLASQPLPGAQAPSSVPALSPQWSAEDWERELGHHTTQLEYFITDTLNDRATLVPTFFRALLMQLEEVKRRRQPVHCVVSQLRAMQIASPICGALHSTSLHSTPFCSTPPYPPTPPHPTPPHPSPPTPTPAPAHTRHSPRDPSHPPP